MSTNIEKQLLTILALTIGFIDSQNHILTSALPLSICHFSGQ